MILKLSKDFKFSNNYKKMNIFSFLLIFLSILVLLFKGLNFGVDFKGGTLIEIRSENININIADIRQSLLKMNLGDINVKKFGNENDYLIKIEKKHGSSIFAWQLFLPLCPMQLFLIQSLINQISLPG